MLNKYIVAIPSYKRPIILKNKTLKLLIEHKIDPKKIIIFVSDNEQKKIYEEVKNQKPEIPKVDRPIKRRKNNQHMKQKQRKNTNKT